jgi:hypothetical protein
VEVRRRRGVGNLYLLKRVRAVEPDSFIIYEPHPDVEADYRKGQIPDAAGVPFLVTGVGGNRDHVCEAVDQEENFVGHGRLRLAFARHIRYRSLLTGIH